MDGILTPPTSFDYADIKNTVTHMNQNKEALFECPLLKYKIHF